MTKEEPGEGKAAAKVPSVTKRPSKKKPKDKPKRPLSAYNFFFKEEREKILKIVLAEDPEKVENKPGTDDYLNPEQLASLRKEGGKVSFEAMGKIIGQRWKNIHPDRLGKFSELAAEDTERYKKEMQTYNGRQEAKMRSEALKPPAAYPVGQPGKGGMAPGYDMSAFGGQMQMQGGYNPYGGMEFGGYPMGMGGMYGPYGGYGGSPESMPQMQAGMDGGQYGRGGGQGMYMMGSTGGFQGGMMGYGGGQGGDFSQQQGMDPSTQGMYYGGQGWGQQ